MDAIGTTASGQGDDTERVRAVIYARTDRKDSSNSIESQCGEVRKYAAHHNMDVIRAYADIGKSGSKIDERDEMKRLLADVASPDRDFAVILVYDLSRWGRFLDMGHAAYCEHICRPAGVELRICNEPPADDSHSTRHLAQHTRCAVAAYDRIRFPRRRDSLHRPSGPRRKRIRGRESWIRPFRGQI